MKKMINLYQDNFVWTTRQVHTLNNRNIKDLNYDNLRENIEN